MDVELNPGPTSYLQDPNRSGPIVDAGVEERSGRVK